MWILLANSVVVSSTAWYTQLASAGFCISAPGFNLGWEFASSINVGEMSVESSDAPE
jgi:hypothetical protein